MMRKTIVRTMSTSTINAFMLDVVNGKPEVKNLEPLTVMGRVTEKDAIKALRDVHGKNAPVTVANIDVKEDTYEISVEDFLKYATKVEKASEDSETKETATTK